eukprot:181853_1
MLNLPCRSIGRIVDAENEYNLHECQKYLVKTSNTSYHRIDMNKTAKHMDLHIGEPVNPQTYKEIQVLHKPPSESTPLSDIIIIFLKNINNMKGDEIKESGIWVLQKLLIRLRGKMRAHSATIRVQSTVSPSNFKSITRNAMAHNKIDEEYTKKNIDESYKISLKKCIQAHNVIMCSRFYDRNGNELRMYKLADKQLMEKDINIAWRDKIVKKVQAIEKARRKKRQCKSIKVMNGYRINYNSNTGFCEVITNVFKADIVRNDDGDASSIRQILGRHSI